MRELYTARLERKLLLSAAAECYHFEFRLLDGPASALEAGQFLSLIADDPAGKTYTRAYSIASGAMKTTPAHFDLCVNRVEGGFFSNLLCDMDEGATVRCHGPHGLFTLRQPPAESLFLAAGTGIAPMRGFLQTLFADDRQSAHRCQLIYEAADPGDFFYDSYFRELAAAHPGFAYTPVLGQEGRHEALRAAIAQIHPGNAADEVAAGVSPSHEGFSRYAYVCGLNELVRTARAQLATSGWQKRQVLFERYD